MNKEIAAIENSIFPLRSPGSSDAPTDVPDVPAGNSFLAKGLCVQDRIIRYSKSPKVGFQYICNKHRLLSFDSLAAQVTLLPDDREDLLKAGKEMLEHGIKTGRFSGHSDRRLADIVKGNTGEQAGCLLINHAFECFGLDTRLEFNKLKYDGRGDGGRDAVVGLYGIDFKYRNDVSRWNDLVASSYEASKYCILIHTHSTRRRDNTDYTDDYYLNVNDSSHITIIRGGITGARFADEAKVFKNGNDMLDKSSEKLVPVWNLVLFLAIQAAFQEGHIEL